MMGDALNIAETIVERQRQLRQILGDAEYESEVAKSRPLIDALVESGNHPNPLAAVLELVADDPSLSDGAINVLICAAGEMCKCPTSS